MLNYCTDRRSIPTHADASECRAARDDTCGSQATATQGSGAYSEDTGFARVTLLAGYLS